jgi:hypothetical protein
VAAFIGAALVEAQAEEGDRPHDLPALLARFAAMPGLEARFQEEKHIALLAQPLVNEGRLWFAPPGHLMRRVDKPHPSTVLVEGARVRVRDGSGNAMDLSGHPAVQAFIESFRALLAGDGQTLERHFAFQYRVTERGWHLGMRPRDASLKRAIRRIEVEGQGVTLTRMVVEEVSGDRSVTRFREVNTRRTFGAGERARLFSLR